MNACKSRRAVTLLAIVSTCAFGMATSVQAAVVTRGPYLQMGSHDRIVVRWRTDVATDSRVSFGPCFGVPSECLPGIDGDAVQTTEHVVTLTGLLPDTRYYYAVGTAAQILAGNDANHFFYTSPQVSVAKPTRVWVLGDSGTANSSARAVRDAYYSFTGSRHTDLWLMLGDNAYSSGTDSEYQAAVFNMYPQMLRKSVLWPTLGNHDGSSADSGAQSGPYYNIFTLPKNGEAGGASSGTEAYYSFDYGNIHFVVLDSFDSNRSPNGAMMNWLRLDLAATSQDWIIAFWHHPPYSKGSHDSDDSSQLREMRQYALPILEDFGVDLVLSGHSHSYERSFLLNGHYGTSNTLVPAMILDGGDGREMGDGAYQKPSLRLGAHEGAVYTVAGSSGKTSGGSLNHPAMFISLEVLGSLVLDVNGNRLDGTFLQSTGAVRDTFTILKGSSDNNGSPVAGNDSGATDEDIPLGIAVLTNDTDPDSDSLLVTAVTQPPNGSVTINADNTVTYTPTSNFNGPNSFSYTVSDTKGGRSTATVTLTVRPVNDIPVAADRAVTTSKNTAVQILLSASDPDGETLSYRVSEGPAHGVLSGSGPNQTYTPTAGYVGSDSFRFVANDGTVDSNLATVSITIADGPLTTSLQSPTANAPVTSSAGDRNGFETNRTNAYADDGLFALDTNSGSSSSSTSCTSSSKDKHVFYNYNLSIPSGSVIRGIEVRLDGRVDSTSGSPRFCVQLSWNGGSSWTTARTTGQLTRSEATYILGSPADLWGRSWTTGNFGNSSFRVRVISIASSSSRDFSLDWVAVRVSHQPAP